MSYKTNIKKISKKTITYIEERKATMHWLDISHDKKLCDKECNFFNTVIFYSQYSGYCFVSKIKMSKILNVSERSIERYVKKLTEMDYIRKEKCGDGWILSIGDGAQYLKKDKVMLKRNFINANLK